MPQDTTPMICDVPVSLAEEIKATNLSLAGETIARKASNFSTEETIARFYLEKWLGEHLHQFSEDHPDDIQWVSLLAGSVLAHPGGLIPDRLRFVFEMIADLGVDQVGAP